MLSPAHASFHIIVNSMNLTSFPILTTLFPPLKLLLVIHNNITLAHSVSHCLIDTTIINHPKIKFSKGIYSAISVTI